MTYPSHFRENSLLRKTTVLLFPLYSYCNKNSLGQLVSHMDSHGVKEYQKMVYIRQRDINIEEFLDSLRRNELRKEAE